MPLREWESSVEADLASVPAVRRVVSDLMAGWGWTGEPLDDALLVFSELVANAVVHGARPGDRITVRVQELDGDCRIEVVDTRPDLLLATRATDTAEEGGRGLLLVRACATDMAVVTGRGQKRVWARVRNCSPGEAA
ncbi:ATP-binding protein [Kitasatospora sp. NBC_00070]|uniref:ATP-binding protein n=1 Tax=Kitasatospora sp. NBC_00070 TaxID=2975962 RepID=UPI00324E7EC4